MSAQMQVADNAMAHLSKIVSTKEELEGALRLVDVLHRIADKGEDATVLIPKESAEILATSMAMALALLDESCALSQ